MSDSLREYYADIYAIEERWRVRFPAETFNSRWPRRLRLLRAVDAKHGIEEDDPRVYSIAAYKAEHQAIGDDYLTLSQENGWHRPNLSEEKNRDCLTHSLRHDRRQINCQARHFPGLNILRPESADTIPKLWCSVGHYRDVCRTVMRGVTRAEPPERRRPAAAYPRLEDVYGRLLALGLPWARKPPFGDFTLGEALIEFELIARRLEEADAECRREFGEGTASATSAAAAAGHKKHAAESPGAPHVPADGLATTDNDVAAPPLGRNANLLWTAPDSVTRWGKVYGISRNTMTKRLQDRTYRNRKVGRLYEIVVADLPAQEQHKHLPATP